MHIASWIAKPSVHAISATVYCTCMLNSPHNSPFVNGHNWSCKNLTLPEFCCWLVLVAFKYLHSKSFPGFVRTQLPRIPSRSFCFRLALAWLVVAA